MIYFTLNMHIKVSYFVVYAVVLGVCNSLHTVHNAYMRASVQNVINIPPIKILKRMAFG